MTNSGAIGEENHIELAALGNLCAVHVVLDVQRRVGRDGGMAPGGLVVTMASDRHADLHFALVQGGLFSLTVRLKHAAWGCRTV